MNPAAIIATARRILVQLRHDHRTIALLLLAPTFLLLLMRYVFDAQPHVFQRIGLPLVGIFPLVSMFLVTSIAMLRERTSGTLERLMTMPLAKLDILFGYALAFLVMAVVQAAIVSSVAIGLLGVQVEGPVWMAVVLAIANALFGMTLGLFLSAFASSEFQAIQFMPAFLMPQLVLSGLFGSRETMAGFLQAIAVVNPMSYAYDALNGVATNAASMGDITTDLGVVVVVSLACLVLGAATLRRRTA